MKSKLNQYKMSMNEKDSSDLADIAKILGIDESEVLRKGLMLMSLYAELKKTGSGCLILRTDEGNTDRELTM